MLKQRLLTAGVLIPIILALLFFLSPAIFCVVLALITLLASWEWGKLMGLARLATKMLYFLIILLTLYNTMFVPIPIILTVSFIWWCLVLVLVISYERGGYSWWGRGVFIRGLMGVLTLVPCWAALSYIRNQHDGFYAIVYLLVLVCGADTVAYFVGKKYGRRKLAPLVSPGKSIEGVLGALVYAVMLTLVVLWLSEAPVSIWVFAVIAAMVTVVFSIVGDLFESMMKRHIGVKDSGNILPGHGGILDRIDSLTAAAPVFAFLTAVLSTYW